MSDKYYLPDCFPYENCCQNSYKMSYRRTQVDKEQVREDSKRINRQAKWWQSLWEREPQQQQA